MHIRTLITLLGVLLLAVSGCSNPTVPQTYMAQTSPENVLENLQAAYRSRDIDGYTVLLAPEFVFKTQDGDVFELGESFNRDQDVAGTGGLFSFYAIVDIRIDLTYKSSTEVTESGFDPGTRKIRVQPVFLEVDEETGSTWQVDGDIQDFFFRPGDSGDGENPDHWVIIEWRDIPASVAAPFEAVRRGVAATRPTTWGQIKVRYYAIELDS